MKLTKLSKVLAALTLSVATSSVSFAGNPDRAGQAGAGQLLINPWARSTGWGGANTANVTGLEAMYMNVAGTAFTKKTELVFAHTNWLAGSEARINSFGFTQRVGETGVLGVGIMSMNFGDIMVTTVDQPEGGLGTFRPSFSNIGVSYAKAFSNSIYGGIVLRVISERVADAGASGVCFDAGVRYVTGENDKIKFGISLRNVGPPMRWTGDGLSVRGVLNSTGANLTLQQRSSPYEMPSMVNIGGSYDFLFSEIHRITAAGTFTSNSFTSDQYRIGLEYGFKSYFMLRGGYVYEEGLGNPETRTTALTGPTGGLTFELPLNDKGTTFGLDYSYSTTNPFNGVHSFGVRITL
jgi:hypothetical protein